MYLGENPGYSILLNEKVSQVISLQGLVARRMIQCILGYVVK